MPTYEYRCAAGHQYEKREGFDAPARQKCQKCSKQATRVLFAPPVVFKGGGFYKTDNRGTSGSGSESASAEPSEPATKPTASTPAADAGHGHSHGPGGHSHGDSVKPATDSVGSAAAS